LACLSLLYGMYVAGVEPTPDRLRPQVEMIRQGIVRRVPAKG